MAPADDELPTLTIGAPEDELRRAMRELQLLVLEHPVVAQRLFRALVAEGRRFAQTEEGQRWKAALADSDLIRRGRVVWEVATLKTLSEDDPSILPSTLLDAFAQVTRLRDLEPFLGSLFRNGARDDSGSDR